MATIVQQYNPWREQLAAKFLGGLLSDAIQRGQAADQTAKNNAFYSKVMEDLSGDQQGQQQMTDPLLGERAMPDGYNDNAWAKSFHDSYTPLTQFDMGTDILFGTPRVNKGTPSAMDFYKMIASNVQDPRFSRSVDLKNAYTMFEPVINAATAQKKKDDAADFMELWKQNEDPTQLPNLLISGMANGSIDSNISNAYSRMYENTHMTPKQVADYGLDLRKQALDELKYNNPNYSFRTVDTGNNVRLLRFNSRTGQPEQIGNFEKDPKYIYKEGNDGILYGINERYGNVEEVKLPNGETFTVPHHVKPYLIKDDNGQYGLINPDTQKPIMLTRDNGTPLIGQQTSKTNPMDTADYNSLLRQQEKLQNELFKNVNEVNKLEAELEGLKTLGDISDFPRANAIMAQIESLHSRNLKIKQEGQELENRRNAMKKSQVGKSTPAPRPSLQQSGMLPPVPQGNRPNGLTSPDVDILLDTPPVSNDVANKDVVPSVIPALGNVVTDDIRPQIQNPLIQPKQPIEQVLQIPREMVYDPSRDKNINPEQIYDDAKINALAEKYKLTPEQILGMFQKYGYKYKQ